LIFDAWLMIVFCSDCLDEFAVVHLLWFEDCG